MIEISRNESGKEVLDNNCYLEGFWQNGFVVKIIIFNLSGFQALLQ